MAAKGGKGSPKNIVSYDEIVNAKSNDRLQVFVMTWNMGNAPETGLEFVLSERNATSAFDIIVLGLQESTYKNKDGTDCVVQLSQSIEKIVGDRFFKVRSKPWKNVIWFPFL